VLACSSRLAIEWQASLIASQRRIGKRLSLEARHAARLGRPGRSAKSPKFLLDDDSRSSIEWRASLIEIQLKFAALRRGEFGVNKAVGETK
jgi:hypothetical protein